MKSIFLTLSAGFASGAQYSFAPESSTTSDILQPYLYQPSETQFNIGLTSSYWTCSFLTASDQHQYMVLGHTMYVNGIGMGRSSILDITDPTFYEMYLYAIPGTNVTSKNGRFDASVGGTGILADSDDNFSKMTTFSVDPLINYNMTVEASTQVLFNGGMGKFNFGGKECTEWALPSAKTEGTLTVRGQELTVDPANSFTWYDRQFGDGGYVNGNYTWFQLHLPASSVRASIWAIDSRDVGVPNKTAIATFRYPDGSHETRSFEFVPSPDNLYTSNSTGKTYPTAWTLNFPGDGTIEVKSIRADQETHNVTSGAPSAYEGFSDVQFNLLGLNETGFGLTEIVKP